MEHDPREQADTAVEQAERSMERDVEDLSDRTERLGEHVEQVRRDWERKRDDPQVPGANARDPEDADGGAVAGDWEGEGPAANEAGQ